MPRFDRFPGERVICVFTPFPGVQQIFRAAVIFVVSPPNSFEIITVLTDQGLEFGVFDTPDVVFDEGDLEILISGNNPNEFQAAAEASGIGLRTGDAGQITIEGLGLGLLASVPGVRRVFANQFITEGIVLAGITSNGANQFVIHWEIPLEPIPASYEEAPGVIFIPVAIIAGFILRALLILGISFVAFLLPKIIMSLKGTPSTPSKPPLSARNGTTGPVGRVMVRKVDGSFITPNPDGTSTCDDPGDCIIVGEPGTEGTKGILGDLKPLIWGAGILVGGLVVVNILNSLPRRNGR